MKELYYPLPPMSNFLAPSQSRTQKEKARTARCALLVAGRGFEPTDLRVMSPTSYRTAPLRDIFIAWITIPQLFPSVNPLSGEGATAYLPTGYAAPARFIPPLLLFLFTPRPPGLPHPSHCPCQFPFSHRDTHGERLLRLVFQVHAGRVFARRPGEKRPASATLSPCVCPFPMI